LVSFSSMTSHSKIAAMPTLPCLDQGFRSNILPLTLPWTGLA
jgi:hypothetical protein